jgi:3-deoxy-D-manno-octulosonic-acid transferase
MILVLYNLALVAALVLSAPWWLWKMATTHKYREGMRERLGGIPDRLRAELAADPRPVVWLHAVSVGEVLAVSRLVAELDRALPQMRVMISTTTKTGQDLARQRFGAGRVFYCPLDLPWAVSAYFRALRPRMLVLAETEFWPNLLSTCFRHGVPVAVVNARISDRSWPRYRRLRFLWARLLGQLTRVLAQSGADAERLRALGCRAERVSVAGNLKYDVRAAQEAEATRLMKQASQGLHFVVAGSTLEGEEAALLEAWPSLLVAELELVLVIAPRHPERFASVAAMLERSGLEWTRRSEWQGVIPPLAHGQVVLLDSIGELASVYSLASVAFVGGSLVPAGGHNPLEPAQFGVPIVMGPHFSNFRAMTEELLANRALRIADNETLAETLSELLLNREEANAMGARARQVFEQQAGATERCVAALSEVLALETVTGQRP